MEKAKTRVTKQRRLIFDELKISKSHPTADELYRTIRKRIPRISLGTIYRNLDYLIKAGLARRLKTGAGQARFDAEMSGHNHIQCRNCGRLDDILVPEFRIDTSMVKADGYLIEGYQLVFLGLCNNCRKNVTD